MSQKSIQNLALNSITLNNSEYQGQTGFVYYENVLKTSDNGGPLLVNNSSVLTQANSKIISIIQAPLTISNNGLPVILNIDLFNYDFICTNNSTCMITNVASGSAIFYSNIVFNAIDNILTINLYNDSADDIIITKLFINLFNP